jgi:outer membrane protein OmpA-like peptidoglycan-associated protein
VGSSAYNLTLSNDRAKSVYEYLIVNGVDVERLSYHGYGDTTPVAKNDTKEGKSKNRRTEFKIIKS